MNRKTLKNALLGTAMIFASLSATESFAQANQGNMNVSAVVPSICRFVAGTSTDMVFDLSTLANQPATFSATASIGWACSTGAVMNIYIDGGGSANPAARVMDGTGIAAGSSIAYSLHTAAGAASPVWGDGTGGTVPVQITGLGMGNDTTNTVYGEMTLAAVENALVGPHDDDVTITLAL